MLDSSLYLQRTFKVNANSRLHLRVVEYAFSTYHPRKSYQMYNPWHRDPHRARVYEHSVTKQQPLMEQKEVDELFSAFPEDGQLSDDACANSFKTSARSGCTSPTSEALTS